MNQGKLKKRITVVADVMIFVFILLLFIKSANNSVLGAGSDPQIRSLSCTTGTAVPTVDGWTTSVFNSTCTAGFFKLNAGKVYRVTANTVNTTTVRTGGSTGANLNYTSPANRYQIMGPTQGSTPINVSTTEQIINDNIASTLGNFTFTLYYTVYQADYGGTTYGQPIQLTLYENNTTNYGTNTANMTFTVPIFNDVTVSAGPHNDLPLYNIGQNYSAPAITVYVKANKPWTLQAKLDGLLTLNSTTIPVGSNYYKVNSGTHYTSNATTDKQFTTVNTYYNIALNETTFAPVTTNNQTLDAINVQTIYSLTPGALYNLGDYTANTTFNLLVP